MKSIIAFLLIALIYVSNSQDQPKACVEYTPSFFDTSHNDDDKNNAYSLDFCRSLFIRTDKFYTCCFMKWRDQNDNHRYNCYPVNHTEMANIDLATKNIESFQQVKDLKSLDCSSSYLYGSLLLILALLF